MNRRIGAPPGQVGGAQNRGAYRPPTINGAKRPALADVSNLQQVDGAGEAKKAKIETVGPDVEAEGQKATNAPEAS